MYTQFIRVAFLVLCVGCAGFASPFLNSDEQYQIENSTEQWDVERIAGAKYITVKFLREAAKEERLEAAQRKQQQFAKYLEQFSKSNWTGGMLNEMFIDNLSKDLLPEDRALLEYFAAKLKIPEIDIGFELSPEKRRVLNLYANTIRNVTL